MNRALNPVTRCSTALSVVVLTALGLAACSTSSPSSTPKSTVTTTKSNSGSASSTSGKLTGLSNSLQGAETTPFKATYSATYNGQSESLTYEQDPPKLLFGASGGEVIDNGTATYFCSTSGTRTCLSSSTEDPLASLLDILSPKTAISDLQAAKSALAAKAAGYSASFSSATLAGQRSTCVTITQASGTEKVCVTGSGELDYVSTSPSQVFEMTSYSTTVNASDFALPSGAQIMTEPSS
jgi:hypothetical protein